MEKVKRIEQLSQETLAGWNENCGYPNWFNGGVYLHLDKKHEYLIGTKYCDDIIVCWSTDAEGVSNRPNIVVLALSERYAEDGYFLERAKKFYEPSIVEAFIWISNELV